jgi:hypothetical protein
MLVRPGGGEPLLKGVPCPGQVPWPCWCQETVGGDLINQQFWGLGCRVSLLSFDLVQQCASTNEAVLLRHGFAACSSNTQKAERQLLLPSWQQLLLSGSSITQRQSHQTRRILSRWLGGHWLPRLALLPALRLRHTRPAARLEATGQSSTLIAPQARPTGARRLRALLWWCVCALRQPRTPVSSALESALLGVCGAG